MTSPPALSRTVSRGERSHCPTQTVKKLLEEQRRRQQQQPDAGGVQVRPGSHSSQEAPCCPVGTQRLAGGTRG